VFRKLHAAQVDRKPRRMGDDSELVAKIRRLRSTGLSLRRVAAEVGVSYPSVRRLFVNAE
jgi:AcrR family transcriptional regulator